MKYANKSYNPNGNSPTEFKCSDCEHIFPKGRQVINVAQGGKNIGKICSKCYSKIKTYSRRLKQVTATYGGAQ